MTNRYDDIIDLPHPVSKKHPPMPAINRAAQFAPFAALSGFDDAIRAAAENSQKTNTEKGRHRCRPYIRYYQRST